MNQRDPDEVPPSHDTIPDLRRPWDMEEVPAVEIETLRPVTFFPSVLQADDTLEAFALDADTLDDD